MKMYKAVMHGCSGGLLIKTSDQLWAESQVLLGGKAVSTVASFSNSHKGVLWVSGHTGEASLKYQRSFRKGRWGWVQYQDGISEGKYGIWDPDQ